MTDIQVGRVLRALRRRLRLTQRQLGERAGVSQQTISLIERGHCAKLSGETMQRVFAAVDARWEPTVSWRGGALDRLLDEAHARLTAVVVERLRAAGWQVAVEATYNEFGERGSIDILAGRRDVSAALMVEVKSDLTVIEATVRKADEKTRLVRGSLCRKRFGYMPSNVGRLLILPATDSARRRVRAASTCSRSPFLHEAQPLEGGCGDLTATCPASSSSQIPTAVVIRAPAAARSGSGRLVHAHPERLLTVEGWPDGRLLHVLLRGLVSASWRLAQGHGDARAGKAPDPRTGGRGRGRPRDLLVRVRLDRVDRGGNVRRAGDAARLLALRPVELLVDLVLGVAA